MVEEEFGEVAQVFAVGGVLLAIDFEHTVVFVAFLV